MSEMNPARRQGDAQVAKSPGILKVSLQQRFGDFHLAVDFQAPLGLIVLFGPSGAGKSLTLRSLAGLLPSICGRISIDGQVLLDSASGVNLPPQQRRVGYVPQHYALFPHLNVAENIAFGLPQNLGRTGWRKDRKFRQARVAELLTILELDGLAQRLPATLSGGQQQRVALARALAAQPRLLLLDEPFNALDATVREHMRDALRQFQRRFGIPIVLVTHDRMEAQQLADTMVILQQGQVAQVGSGENILRVPCTEDVARLVGQCNFFSGHLAAPSDHQQPAPPMALRLDGLPAANTQGRPSTTQGDPPEQAWLPLPANGLSPFLTPQTHLAGCIHADEIIVQRWMDEGIPSTWTTQGSARWQAKLVDAQAYERSIRLLVRPLWAEKPAGDDSGTAGMLEIYLSRREWQEIGAAQGERLLLEIGPQAVHCFESPDQHFRVTGEQSAFPRQ